MKALKAFIKPFEVPEESVKIKIQLNFYFNIISEMHVTLRVKSTLPYLEVALVGSILW